MRAALLATAGFASFLVPGTSARPDIAPGLWTAPQANLLAEWLNAAPSHGLRGFESEAARVRAAAASGPGPALDAAATPAAVVLLAGLRDGCCPERRRDWRISRETPPVSADTVKLAVAIGRLDTLLDSFIAEHPHYTMLRGEMAREGDPGRRATLALNLARWRWLPRRLGSRYLLVNAASFEATLWEERRPIGSWRVVVGRRGSPTPVFAATVTGVTFNPWWEIPPSIAAEGIAASIRRNPAAAAARGYVAQGGRYRQRPGPNNALGLVKLAMPNPYNVYLHDTPSKPLFRCPERTFSHGCVRVDDALGLATALLAADGDWTPARTTAAVASGRSRTVALGAPVPVYVVYFTAEPDGAGGVRYSPDVYGRDGGQASPRRPCPAD